MERDTSVLVVGAGPAGLAAAAAIVHSGLSCRILEAGPPGKDKTCGDGFISSATAFLQRLGLIESDFQAIGQRFDAIALRAAGAEMFRLTNFENSGWILPRRLIDQELRNRISALAPIHYETRVVEVVPTNDDSRIDVISTSEAGRRSDSATGVVIANGAQSRLSRSLGIGGSPVEGISLSTYASLSIDTPWFEFGEGAPLGYYWGFPVSATIANIGVCRLSGGTRRDFRVGVEHLESMLPPQPQPLKWRGGMGPIWNGNFARRHDDRGIVACGDAAGTVDPLTGEGITAALTTGYRAGSAIAGFILNDKGALRRYSQEVTDELRRSYRVSEARSLWPLLTHGTSAAVPS